MHKPVVLAVAAAIAFVGCTASPGTTTTITSTASRLASDVNLVATGLAAALPAIAQVPGVPAATIAQINADLASIQKDAAAVQAATAANGAAPASTVQEIASVVGDIATVALPLVPGGSAIVPVVQAAEALLPGILSAADVVAAGAPANAMDPSSARLILRGAAY